MLLSRKLLFYQNLFPREYFVPGSYDSVMIPGSYEILIRAAGGAGGFSGGTSNDGYCHAGLGGAGGSGKLTRIIITVQNVTTATVYVGSKGVTSGDGYNGGEGGAGGSNYGGKGGGAGKPSYVFLNNMLYSAESGSGGGGGGGPSWRGRNANGGGGGGGGGYYKVIQTNGNATAKRNIDIVIKTVDGVNILKELSDPSTEFSFLQIPSGDSLYEGKTYYNDVDLTSIGGYHIYYTYIIDSILPDGSIVMSGDVESNGTINHFGPGTITNAWSRDVIIQSVAGKKGADYNNDAAGNNGTTGNTAEFPKLYSGGGGPGVGKGGSNGAKGGGASGGSGGDAGNHSDARSGGGGGAAAGSPNGFGGGGSYNNDGGTQRGGGDASNTGTTPIDTTSENALYGITGDYGTGGTTATEGKDGFVVIRQIFIISEVINLGLVEITSRPFETDDAGSITGTVDESDDAGAITGTVDESDDAGIIYEQIPATSTWNLGSITDSVTETKNCGNII